MPGTWTSTAFKRQLNVATALLLTDGSVLAQDDSMTTWWRLYPSATGDYATGHWIPTAPALCRRRIYTSAVLGDGRVLVAGDRYGDWYGNRASRSAKRATAEIYDPVAETWKDVGAPATWNVIGDAPCCVLPDGTVLIGNTETGQCALFDPVLDAWRPAGSKTNGTAKGETWTLLPDETVLAITCNDNRESERYVGGTWRADGTLPAAAALVEAASLETGPAILLPGGTVFALGATGKTAIFQPGAAVTQAGSWQPGPPLPQDAAGLQIRAKDAPACLLPDGMVLFAAAATNGAANDYGATSSLYETDGTAAPVLTRAPLNVAPFKCRLLMLPNGQAMLSTSASEVWFYAPANPANPAWRPIVTQAPHQISPGDECVVLGRGLNGVSQACSFGDDAAMATNYPLVRLVSRKAPATTTYCRTYGHSTMGVATGTAEHSTNFRVPEGVALGEYNLEVVANGIASAPWPVSVVAAQQAARLAAGSSTRNLQDDRALQEEMFWRDLNEVHLLMDYISGRADKSLAALNDVPNPDVKPGTAGAVLSAQDAIQRICLIRFPPEGSPEKKANDAALLLLVKDRLNALAFPARGLSVAFTAMFAGTAGSSGSGSMGALGRSLVDYFGVPGSSEKSVRGAGGAGEKTCKPPGHVTGFAIASYPNLERKAKLFKSVFSIPLPIFALIWLFATAVTSWDVAVSSQVLQTRSADLATVAKEKTTDVNCHIGRNSDGVAVFDATVTAPSEPCKALLRTEQPVDYANDDDRRAVFIDRHLLHPIGFVLHWVLAAPKQASDHAVPARRGPTPAKMAATPPGAAPPAAPAAASATPPAAAPLANAGTLDNEATVWAFAGILVSVFTNYVLPMMFGVLGTLAGVVRGVIVKMRDSTLSPRDYDLMFSLIPLGGVAGLAVGLIVTPGNSLTGASALTLPAAGLAFLAGYGADAFFTMIDNLLTRVFALTPPPSSGSK